MEQVIDFPNPGTTAIADMVLSIHSDRAAEHSGRTVGDHDQGGNRPGVARRARMDDDALIFPNPVVNSRAAAGRI